MKSKEMYFSLSTVFFWLKGTIIVDYRFVKVQTANKILGVIPAGKESQTIPLKNISASHISTSYRIGWLLCGGLLVFISLGMFFEYPFMALLLFILGVGIAGNGIMTFLVIQRAGSDYRLGVPFFDKKKIIEAQSWIEDGLTMDADKTDLFLFHEKKRKRKKSSRHRHK